MAPRLRLTASLVLRGEVAGEIDGLRRGLGAAALERIPPHLTLVPPVNVREEELGEALSVLRRAAAGSGPLVLELGPPATFFPASPVLYLAVGGDLAQLVELRGRLLAGPLSTPQTRQEREFVPHVTLDQSIDPGRIEAALATLSSYRARVVLEEVTLLFFEEEERRWRPLADAALGARRVVGRGGLELVLETSRELDPEAARFKEAQWAEYGRLSYGAHRPDEPFAITARSGGAVVGTATGQLRGRLCRLGNLVVASGERRNGVGSKLLRAVEQLATERGAERVRLETRAGGPAEDFYRRRGYEATTLLPAWREERDFLLMEKALFLPPR